MKNQIHRESNLYRFMCIKSDHMNYHIDFKSYNEAMQYVYNLNDSKISWYGLYELESSSNKLKLVTHKRLVPHEESKYKH